MFKKIMLLTTFIVLVLTTTACTKNVDITTTTADVNATAEQTKDAARKVEQEKRKVLKTAIKENDIQGLKVALVDNKFKLTRVAQYVCEDGSVEALELLEAEGLSLEVKDSNGFSLLHYAVFYDNIALARYLIAHHQDVNARANDNRSVFIFSANSSIEMFELLQNTPIKVSQKDRDIIVSETLVNNNLILATYLIKQKYPFDINDYKEGETISKAIKNGHIDVITFLVEQGLDIERKYKWHYWNNAMLCYANAFQQDKIEKFLLAKNADIYTRCTLNGNERYVDKAVKKADLAFYETLLKQGFDPKKKGPRADDAYPLALALKYNNIPVAKHMVANGVNTHVYIDEKESIFYLARQEDVTLLKLMVQNGANPNLFDKDSLQPIDYASTNSEIYIYLLGLDDTATFLKRYENNKTSEQEYRNYASKIIRRDKVKDVKLISADPLFGEVVFDVLYMQLREHYPVEYLAHTLEVVRVYNVDSIDAYSMLNYPDKYGYDYFVRLADTLATPEVLADDKSYLMLLEMIKENKLKEVKYLVSKGASLKYVDNNFQYHLLHAATFYADADMVTYLLTQKEVDTLAVEHSYKFAIDIALNRGDFNVTKALMQKPVGREDYELVSLALKKGDDKTSLYFLEHFKVDKAFALKNNLLLYAVGGQSQKAVTYILDLGVDINNKSAGTTALGLAVKNHQVEMVQLLLEKGADTSSETNGELLYIYTSYMDDDRKSEETYEKELAITQLLLDHNVTTDNMLDRNYNTSLSLCIAAKKLDFATLLMDGGAHIDESDIELALHFELDKPFILKMIADFNAKDITNTSNPLFKAVEYEDKEVIKLLLDKGFDLYKNLNCGSEVAPIYAIGMSNDTESTAYALAKIKCIDTERGWLKILVENANNEGYTKIEDLVDKRYEELQPCP